MLSGIKKTVLVVAVGTVALCAGGVAIAQADPKIGTTVSDPPGPVPDPSHVPVFLPKDIKCIGTEGAQQACILFGDPNKGRPSTG